MSRTRVMFPFDKEDLYVIIIDHLRRYFVSSNSGCIMLYIAETMYFRQCHEVDITYDEFLEGRRDDLSGGIPGLNRNNLKYELYHLSGRRVTTVRKSDTSLKANHPTYAFININKTPRRANRYSFNYGEIMEAARRSGADLPRMRA